MTSERQKQTKMVDEISTTESKKEKEIKKFIVSFVDQDEEGYYKTKALNGLYDIAWKEASNHFEDGLPDKDYEKVVVNLQTTIDLAMKDAIQRVLKSVGTKESVIMLVKSNLHEENPFRKFY